MTPHWPPQIFCSKPDSQFAPYVHQPFRPAPRGCGFPSPAASLPKN